MSYSDTSAALDEYNPFAERKLKHPLNAFDFFVHILKSTLGAGIMVMPFAFKYIGLWGGIIVLLIVGSLITYCIQMLVSASQALCYRWRFPSLSYAETAVQAFLHSTAPFNEWTTFVRFMVNILIILDTLGAVTLYLIDAAEHTKYTFEHFYPDYETLHFRIWILIVSVPMLGFCLIRNLKFLMPFSLFANLLLCICVVNISVIILKQLPPTNQRNVVITQNNLAMFYSISIFALANAEFFLPCENEMKNAKRLTTRFSVLYAAMIFLIVLHASMGFLGYLKYGDRIEKNIIMNLPENNLWSIRIIFALAMYFSILLDFYVPMQIFWQALRNRVPDEWKNLNESLARVCVMLLCVTIAMVCPYLKFYYFLFCAISSCCLSFTIPAILDVMVFRMESKSGAKQNWRIFHLIKDYFIIILGLTSLLACIIESLNNLRGYV